MRLFKCSCGNPQFEINRDCAMIKCLGHLCHKRYIFQNGKWTEFQVPVSVSAKELFQAIKEDAIRPALDWVDARLKHMPRTKTSKCISADHLLESETVPQGRGPSKALLGAQIQEQEIRQKWAGVIFMLSGNNPKPFVFEKHSHFGDLRGKSAAKICHRDLRRIGIKTKLTFKNDDAVLEAV